MKNWHKKYFKIPGTNIAVYYWYLILVILVLIINPLNIIPIIIAVLIRIATL